ncbi:MAG: ribonuclease III domain-containing protein [Candidatus Omnitrophota bacterium]
MGECQLSHRLEEMLEYTFQTPELLKRAVTHRSYANEKGIPRGNETLALLGDSVLQFFVTSRLYSLTPEERPGHLTEKRKSFVCEEILSKKAKQLHLGEALLFGRGEKQQGGPMKSSHLAEAFEAVVGSIYLDGGLSAATQFLSKQFEELQEVPLRVENQS